MAELKHGKNDVLTEDRFKGCLLGLACGDAVGTTVEFSPRGTFQSVTTMIGGGPFDLKAGHWTDDTSMALCLAHSLLHSSGFDARDQMNRYVNWRDHGYMSSTGHCFDIGGTVNTALNSFQIDNDPFAGSEDSMTAGNGGIMRIAPVPMFYFEDRELLLRYSAESSRTTHAAAEAIDAAKLFSLQLRLALLGSKKEEVLLKTGFQSKETNIAALVDGKYINKSEDQIKGSGYVVESLEAALWCFYHSESFEDAILKAANLGDDADTTAAITGQLAGAYYGVSDIPLKWLTLLHQREDIEKLAVSLFNNRHRPEKGGIDNMNQEIVTLYRPTGPEELKLVEDSGYKRWPPRLPEQPIFYLVTNEQYAKDIAIRWNIKDSGVGYVTRFAVKKAFMDRYEVEQVGASHHTEWWIPAEDLNDNIVGDIEVIGEYK